MFAALGATAGNVAAQDRGPDDGPTRPLLTLGDSVRVTLGGYLQADARLADGPVSGSNGVLLRRARLTFEAAGRGGWRLRLQPDFGQGRAQIQDGFVAWRGDAVEARVGRFRPPFGVERTLSSAALLFPERSLLNAFMPSRLFGAEVAVRRGQWTVAAGGFQAAGLGDALVDTDGDPVGVAQAGADAVVRATWRPLGRAGPSAENDGAPSLLELQAGGMVGHYRGTSPEFPGVERFLTPAQRAALAWPDAAGGSAGSAESGPGGATFADGTRRRGTAGAQVARGPLHVLAEGAWLAQRVRRDTTGAGDGPGGTADRARLRHASWHVRASWLAGGSRTPDYDVRPRGPRGAVEVGLRAAGARFSSASARFARPDASARAMASVGVAVAWVPRPGTRLAASLDVTRLTAALGAGPRGTERAAVLRVQQGF